jgi:hypothetical protein
LWTSFTIRNLNRQHRNSAIGTIEIEKLDISEYIEYIEPYELDISEYIEYIEPSLIPTTSSRID